jgi:cell division protein FtsB
MEPGNRKILVYQPVYAGLGIALAAVLLAIVGYLLFQRGMYHASDELERLVEERAGLEQTIEELERHNRELREQIVILERSSEIDRRASLEVRNEFAGLQAELLELRKELEFYRGIVSPGDAKAGLRIQSFNIAPAEESGSFVYNLTLTQVKGNERYVRGVIEMEIEGLEDGEPKVLLFNKLAQENSKVLSYKFRYFQNFEGEIWIPAKFVPKRVRVLLKPRGKGQPSGVEKIMEWPV